MAPLADLFNHGNVSSSYSFSPDAVRARPTGTPRRRAATPERSDAAPAAAMPRLSCKSVHVVE
jgi:hypothetical protein